MSISATSTECPDRNVVRGWCYLLDGLPAGFLCVLECFVPFRFVQFVVRYHGKAEFRGSYLFNFWGESPAYRPYLASQSTLYLVWSEVSRSLSREGYRSKKRNLSRDGNLILWTRKSCVSCSRMNCISEQLGLTLAGDEVEFKPVCVSGVGEKFKTDVLSLQRRQRAVNL